MAKYFKQDVGIKFKFQLLYIYLTAITNLNPQHGEIYIPSVDLYSQLLVINYFSFMKLKAVFIDTTL